MQNQNRIEKLSTKRTIPLFRWLVCIPLLLFGTILSAYGEGPADLLLIPSEISTKAPEEFLVDVVNNGERLVAVGHLGRILLSNIEGKDLKQAKVPVSVTLLDVTFTSPQKGWAVGHDGVILHTKDGGYTWQKKLDGYEIDDMMIAHIKQIIQANTKALEKAEKSQNVPQLEALNQEHEKLSLYLKDFEVYKKDGPHKPLMDMWFKDEKEGIVIGAFGIILKTIDMGENWMTLLDGLDNFDGWHLYGITQSGNDLFIAGERGILFRSDDWGKNWRSLESSYNGSLYGIIGNPNGSFVIAFGMLGNVFYSHDRGENWSISEFDNETSIYGGTLLADGSVCLICADGTLMRSTDGGRTFEKLSEKFPDGAAVTERSAGNLVGVGLSGIHLLDNAY